MAVALDYSTIEQWPFDPTPPPGLSYAIGVTEGPDASRTITIDDATPGRLHIGTSPQCELVLTDRAVSRRHVSIELSGAWLRVVDLESKNGTTVNGVRIANALLAGGETLRIGSSSLVVTRGPAAAVKLPQATAFGRMRGASREMRRLYPLCERLAASDVPVIIEGETGTGKEVLAECLHDAGKRSAGPFVVLDCTSIAPSLVESILFGHERGAFTGASAQHAGVFEEANGGTLFIDELGDLDPSMQPKLLRAVERSEIRRVGGTASIKVDVRIIAATRRSLDAEIEAGRFRDDLFHRLAIGRIELPPLRARRGDVAILVEAFCKEMGTRPGAISPALLSGWESAAWPGNVRELRNAVARHLALGELAEANLPSEQLAPPSTASGHGADTSAIAIDVPYTVARQRIIEDFERTYVERVLAAHGGNVSQAARASGIARRNFQLLRARTLR